MSRRERKASFTIIEVLIALCLLAIVAGAIALGIQRSVQATQLKTSKERLERLFLQAFRFSAVSGHVGEVVVRKRSDGMFEGYVNLWGQGTQSVSLIAQSCGPIGQLAGIDAIAFNGRTIHKAVFRFFGGHGLSSVCVYDQDDRKAANIEFDCAAADDSPMSRDLDMIVRPTKDPTTPEIISLKPYLLSVPHHLPFPNEYLTNGL